MRLTVARIAAAALTAVALWSAGSGSLTSGNSRFVTKRDGVVFDRKTKLWWTSRDYERALDWVQADRHCEELVLDERSSWRLPRVKELEALYDAQTSQPCGNRPCHLDRAIQLAEPYVWSATSRGVGTRFYYNFSGGHSLSPGISPSLVRRVLCVHRSGPATG